MTFNPIPKTIGEAFGLWLECERAAIATVADQDEMTRHLERGYELEDLALTLPASSAADVWKLLRMTSDTPNELPRVTQDRVIARAFAECGE
jgi:hypothetical protein